MAKARIAVAQKAPDALRVLEVVPARAALQQVVSPRQSSVPAAAGQSRCGRANLSRIRPNRRLCQAATSGGSNARLIARELLDRGNPYAAYAMVRDNVAESVEKRVDADFRRVDCPSLPSTPRNGGASLRKCRSNCCEADLGRANEILAGTGSGGAWRWPGGARLFEAAAAHSTTYYGPVGPDQTRPFKTRDFALNILTATQPSVSCRSDRRSKDCMMRDTATLPLHCART